MIIKLFSLTLLSFILCENLEEKIKKKLCNIKYPKATYYQLIEDLKSNAYMNYSSVNISQIDEVCKENNLNLNECNTIKNANSSKNIIEYINESYQLNHYYKSILYAKKEGNLFEYAFAKGESWGKLINQTIIVINRKCENFFLFEKCKNDIETKNRKLTAIELNIVKKALISVYNKNVCSNQ